MTPPRDGLIDREALVRIAALEACPVGTLIDGWGADAALLQDLLVHRARRADGADMVPLARTAVAWLDDLAAAELRDIAQRIPDEMADMSEREQRDTLALLAEHLAIIAMEFEDLRGRLPPAGAGPSP